MADDYSSTESSPRRSIDADARRARLLANMHAYWTAFAGADLAPRSARGEIPGLVWWLSGIADPQLNGVLQADLDAEAVAGTVAELRERVAGAGVPLVWWVGADSRPAELGARLSAAGLPEVDTTVLMSLPLDQLPDESPSAELTVRPVVERSELSTWADVVGTAFHLDERGVGDYRRFEVERPVDERYLRFGGLVDGVLVATSALFVEAGVAGVYTVATLPEHGRRGYGRALTLAALAEARRRGLEIGTLQATAAGRPVYERMGFDSLDTFRLHLLTPAEQ